ncbi:hypothetical protein AB0M94_09225 [Streptomyces xanthochromogenes]|uniref:Uncharacterized protein n=1 Tax=Streptomyces xanthochromogenes TaxID=67384 RepID=A0ABQ3AWU0_9ACTN|nr:MULTISPECIES: hypothetical protein [Streptomyces]MYV91974.1 hypothetical protein [Streptomyces sp. SID1034]GGY70343.1 hypothetical protein GCM10010326_75790 [Streptomyces xanthochromogenes]
MGRKSAGLVGIVAAVLAFGLGATIEAGQPQVHPAGARVVADDRGPTVITPHGSSTVTLADDRGPTVIAPYPSPTIKPADDRGPTGATA